jgi:aspartate aminotransferase-like enzyme
MDPRSPEYTALLLSCISLLKEHYQTRSDVLIFPGSGTGGLEAAVVNTLSPGDAVLAVAIGVWGDRWAALAEAFGLDVRRLSVPRGKAVKPDQLRQALDENTDVVAVLLTHDEASTGVTNPLAELAPLVRERDLLLLVDASTSLGALPLRTDEWGLDVVVGASHEAWGMPPGLVTVGVSERGWKSAERARLPRYYWDFRTARSAIEKGPLRYLIAPGALAQLRAALERIRAEGSPEAWCRHERLGARARRGVRELGFELFAEERSASNALTSFKAPEGLDAATLRARLPHEPGVRVLDGLAEMSGRVLRIPHFGLVSEADVDALLEAMAGALEEPGRPQATG